jgi:NAD(P)-dependent dehydrogenase (short-subunit alcohol dehydrogenase family)
VSGAATKPVAVVTGASSGIGRATARRLAASGYRVAVVARREELLRALVAELERDYPAGHVAAAANLSQWSSVSAAATAIERAVGHVDLLVNNAGGFAYRPFEETDTAVIDDLVAVNVTGTMYATRAFLPLLRKAAKGSRVGKPVVVFVSSLAGLWGYRNMAPYSATKFAVTGFADALARELEPAIRVCTIFPGPVNTALEPGQKSTKKFVLTAEEAADHVFRLATGRGRATIQHPAFRKFRWLQQLAPRLADRWLGKMYE